MSYTNQPHLTRSQNIWNARRARWAKWKAEQKPACTVETTVDRKGRERSGVWGANGTFHDID